MAKHDTDPVLRQLVRAINEAENAAVPVTVSVHGTQLTGALIGERVYFGELVGQYPLMSALEPSSGLLGKEYAKDAEAESDHHLHLRESGNGDDAGTTAGLWRISLAAVDGWSLRAYPGVEPPEDKGPFARLLSS
jgi:hypothetical protein